MNKVVTTSKSDSDQPKKTIRQRLAYIFGQYTIQWLLLFAAIILSVINPNFRQFSNIRNILLQSSFIGIGAAGVTLVIINGGIDLSVAGIVGLCGVVLAMLVPKIGIAGAIIVTLILGLILGWINGVVVVRVRVPAFIATLGMMNIYLAIGFIITNAKVLPVTDKTFRALATKSFFGFPIPFLAMIVVYLICFVVLKYTFYGRFIRAVGSNQMASFIAGVSVDKVRIFAFMLVGFFTAVACVFLTGYLSHGQAIMAIGYELRVIAVAVVGGTSLKGGSGTLIGSFTGALFFTMISNSLNLLGVGAYWQYVAVGLIIITALGIESLRRRVLGIT